jgi:D-glycero-alpha-D-manno-heptose-7-phosphate kinase
MMRSWRPAGAGGLDPQWAQWATVRCRAPLRLGLAGGGTDLSPYCEDYGGTVLNVAINRFALTTIEPRRDGVVRFVSHDLNEEETVGAASELPTDSGLRLHRALYNRIVRDFRAGEPLALTLTTSVECPKGAGLGASSALLVSMIGAYRTWLGLPLGDFEVAHLAWEVERRDLGLTGGRQDQYAATFGGVNFIEFAAGDRVIVNPLQLERNVTHELETSILLGFTGVSRLSSDIIDKQIAAVKDPQASSGAVEGMHQLKRDALELKAALLREELHLVPDIINRSWLAKKNTAQGISNAHIDGIYEAAMSAGALGGKISGAGGGGFLMLFTDPLRREAVRERVESMGVTVSGCTFSQEGVFGWRVPGQTGQGR